MGFPGASTRLAQAEHPAPWGMGHPSIPTCRVVLPTVPETMQTFRVERSSTPCPPESLAGEGGRSFQLRIRAKATWRGFRHQSRHQLLPDSEPEQDAPATFRPVHGAASKASGLRVPVSSGLPDGLIPCGVGQVGMGSL